MTIKSNFPSIRPSLNLDFANTRALDPRITFTRTTTATYYDGKTTAKAEENLLQYSQEFDDAYWTKTRTTVTANNTTAPDGTSTAESVLETVDNNTHFVGRVVTVSSGLTHTISVFAKANGRNYIALYEGITAKGKFFDITAGGSGAVLGNLVGAPINASITAVGNDWFRCVIEVTASTTANPSFYTSTDGTTFSYAGDITKGVYLWGAQLEQRSAVTDYTPTTTAPITNYIPALQTAASGVARFDHNPTTGESLGLLIEEQRTNLCLQSEDFSTTWSATRSSITTNTIVAPNGTLTGDKLVEDTTASNTHSADQFITVVTNTDYTFSCYVKAAERSQIQLFAFHAASGTNNTESVIFNLSTLTVGTDTSVAQRNTITSVGNGWYRISGVFKNQIDTGTSYSIRMIDNSGNSSYTGDGYSGIYIWGAQVEAGAFPTSYIATTSASVTRNADAASMTGTNFSSWYRADEGTVYAESSTPQASSTFMGIVNLGKQGTTTVSFQLGRNGTNSRGFGDGVSIDQGSNTYPVNTFVKQAEAGAVNNFALSTNGSNVATDTSTNPMRSDMDYLRIRDAASGAAQFSGYLKKIAFYPSRLSNAQLQALTAS